MGDYNSNWESTYWKFRVVQFERRLDHHSGAALVLPKSFVENVTEKMAEKITLKTASGAEWQVGLETGKDGNVFLKYGWKEFVKSHFLKENDTLYFKYFYGDSKLEVTMFDGETSIEKACSHFVENPLHDPVNEIKQNDKNCRLARAAKHKAESSRRASTDDDSDPELVLTRKKKSMTRGGYSRHASSDDDSDSELYLTRKPSSMRTHCPTGNLTSARKRARGDYSDHSSHLTRELHYPGCHDSSRPNQTTGTNSVKKQQANEDGVLEVYMYHSYVHPLYSLCLSRRWALDNIVESQDILLVNKDGKTTKVKFYVRKRAAALEVTGWRAFAKENHVEKGDRCYFSVVPGSRDPITLDVRVVHADGGGKEAEEEVQEPNDVSPF